MSRTNNEAKAATISRLITECVREMEALETYEDYEYAHGRADELLCTVLKLLGKDSLVTAWEKVGKWYA